MERNRLIEDLHRNITSIAICAFLEGRTEIASANTIWANVNAKNGAVYWHVLKTLVEKQILIEVKDEFGPSIFRRGPKFKDEWDGLKKVPDTPYFRFALDPQRDGWIVSAMEAVNKALEEAKIKPQDFQKIDAEWEPLPVDRTNPKLVKATEQLDETIAAVEADNGYNATLPDEKTYVVENLKDASQRLKKEDAISYAYLKRKVIDVLDIVIRRFGGAAVGLAAQAARAAIFDWLKEFGSQVLHWLA